MAGRLDEIEVENERLRAEGRTHMWNSVRHAVESFDISRTALAEHPEVAASGCPGPGHLAMVHVHGSTQVERAEAQVVRRLQ
ncbi:hypothetical protein [Streptomyces sp. NBC_00576]|uniref:hypothetical protein n=1 Tax=Streptomyces sp. NBC_00576 TaxID=2903665 RepID=UPI002E818D66|nr:hypothetical protein [Streptomyces sp. NBC_00576]WUB72793.1 hypothetical protein OG734_23270 [Streptomyces sp. NBC_00576]